MTVCRNCLLGVLSCHLLLIVPSSTPIGHAITQHIFLNMSTGVEMHAKNDGDRIQAVYVLRVLKVLGLRAL